jgi:hypothetical protein
VAVQIPQPKLYKLIFTLFYNFIQFCTVWLTRCVNKVRVSLREEGVIILKGPIKEFYSQFIKLSGFGIGGLLVFSGKKAGKMAGHT